MSPGVERAIVLAAGMGTRMRPLTDRIPKPLVEVAGRCLIDRLLDALARAGVGQAVVNVHHLADRLIAHLQERGVAGGAPEVLVSDERNLLLDTGGGVRRVLPLLGEGAFLVLNADTLWHTGMREPLDLLLESWDPALMDGLLLLAPTVTSTGYDGRGDFVMDPAGRLDRREEPRVAPFVYAGAAIMTARSFDDTPDGPFSLNLVWDRLVERGRLYGCRLDGRFLHVGTIDAIAEAEAALADPG